MNFLEKNLAIQFIRPNAEYVMSDGQLNWLDKNQSEPTENEINQAWIDYQNIS